MNRQPQANHYPSGEFDAQKWAEEFARIFPDGRPDTGTMIGWFANALMTGYDHGRRGEEVHP